MSNQRTLSSTHGSLLLGLRLLYSGEREVVDGAASHSLNRSSGTATVDVSPVTSTLLPVLSTTANRINFNIIYSFLLCNKIQ